MGTPRTEGQPTTTRPGAKITRVETIPLRLAFRTPHKISLGPARPGVEVLIVRLHTDEGVTGIGETQAWRRHGSSETLASLTAVIQDHFAPHLVGRSPFDIASIMHTLDRTIYHGYYAQAAISDALYDLQGKLLGVPLYELFGGRCRDRISICGLLSIKPRLAETVEDAERLFAAGYRTFVIKTDDNVAADVSAVKAVRERLGEEALIRIDSNAAMTYKTALELLKKVEPYGLQAAEQLLEIWDLEGTIELARRTNIPLLADESVASDHDLLTVIAKRAASAFQTKIAKNGGLWYIRKLWEIADAAGFGICPGNHPCTTVGTAAAAHLATAWPRPLLDGPFAFGITALEEDIVVNPMRVEEGGVCVPTGPGLGVTLDDEKIAALRLDR